jgi:hypothetical protein
MLTLEMPFDAAHLKKTLVTNNIRVVTSSFGKWRGLYE